MEVTVGVPVRVGLGGMGVELDVEVGAMEVWVAVGTVKVTEGVPVQVGLGGMGVAVGGTTAEVGVAVNTTVKVGEAGAAVGLAGATSVGVEETPRTGVGSGGTRGKL